MSLLSDALLVLYSMLIFLFAGYQWFTLWNFPELPSSSTPERTSFPLVSIIVPARNQAKTIEECIDSLIRMDYPNKEVLVVEGHSTDQTRSILNNFHDKIRVIDEGTLPLGWVGKNWACHLGYRHANGQVFLFTDGDSVHSVDGLSRTVGYLQSSNASLVTLAPRAILKSFWEKLLQPPIFLVIMLFVGGKLVNDDKRPKNALGNGQYMLFTREAYEKVRGHEAVKEKIVEDYNLARRVKEAGLRLRFVAAQGVFGVRMYSSLQEIWVGWRKNFYTISDKQRFPRAIIRLLILFVFLVFPFVVLAQGVYQARIQPLNASLLAGVFMCFWLWLGITLFYKRGAKTSPLYGLFLPLAVAIYMLIGIDSTIRGALGLGLAWKGRVYERNTKLTSTLPSQRRVEN